MVFEQNIIFVIFDVAITTNRKRLHFLSPHIQHTHTNQYSGNCNENYYRVIDSMFSVLILHQYFVTYLIVRL